MRKLHTLWLAILLITTMLTGAGLAQETTGALQGTVKDSTGAVIPGATVTAAAPTLVGTKTITTDERGYFHLSNLPPGTYSVTVTMKGFTTLKRQGLTLEVGHSPSLDLAMAVGDEGTVVEVTSQAPAIDVTSVTTQSNITNDVINFVPRGTSFQSVIQFAPAATNEPLMGSTMTNGTGAVSPGSGTNGSPYGYSVAGGADSENSYLVEGQETANLIGGYSHTNVPFDFIDQVQVKSSGIQAEYGGALGGVVDVIMKKGSPHYHGSLFISFQDSDFNAGTSSYGRYDPTSGETYQPTWSSPFEATCTSTVTTNCYKGFSDAPYQGYTPKKAGYTDVFPGFTLGGPLLPMFSSVKDKLFFFVAFNPDMQRLATNVNYGPAISTNTNPANGTIGFAQNTNTYYTTARIDAQVTQKIRVFGSWLYQLQRRNGENLPGADSVIGYNYTTQTGPYNPSSANTPSTYAHTLGYDAPNTTVNTGADITVTQHIVSTTRFGYYFENYHDFGYPTGNDVYTFQTSTGKTDTDALGNALPANLQQSAGAQINSPLDNLTAYNSNKAIQLDEAISWYKSTGLGTHNFKFGYQLNRLSNLISQVYNQPNIQIFVGDTSNSAYSPGGTAGDTNCAAFIKKYGQCQGQYGYVNLFDYGTGGSAISYNHSFFVQDSWTIGKGVTVDAGVRLEHEALPGEVEGPGVPPDPISFGWGSKIAPRVGAAWDVFQNGKMKAFGSYGVFTDQMKLNVAISSFGGQYWNNCAYALDTPNITSLKIPYDSANRYCQGNDSSVNSALATVPAGLTFLENLNNRAATPTCSTCNPYEEAVAPNLKPYTQHESVFGTAYQLSKSLSIEARWDRRRIDHVIEDSAIYNPAVGETFVIVNPGEGVSATFPGFCQFLYSTDPSGCASTVNPPNGIIKPARSYDGVEFRLNKAMSNHWFAMVSYTYSHFRGNYTGLTSSDIADGGAGGRNAPNNSRSFDEPYFSWNASGGSSSGLLPTDRPNKFKGYAYYRLDFLHKFTTDFGLFQYMYQGSPNTSYADVGYSEDAFPVDLFSRGKWASVTQNPTTGAITVGSPYTYRNPWYIQSDFNITQEYRLSEGKSLSFDANFTNLLNEHVVTAINEQIDSPYDGNQYIRPNGTYIASGVPFYAAAESAYPVQASLNGAAVNGQRSNSSKGPEIISSEYGTPLYYQLPRGIRLAAHFTF
jgi:hypothetical protein